MHRLVQSNVRSHETRGTCLHFERLLSCNISWNFCGLFSDRLHLSLDYLFLQQLWYYFPNYVYPPGEKPRLSAERWQTLFTWVHIENRAHGHFIILCICSALQHSLKSWTFVQHGLYLCLDITECGGSNPCHVNATCTEEVGGFRCDCNPGFSGDGMNCASNCHFILFYFIHNSKNYWPDKLVSFLQVK